MAISAISSDHMDCPFQTLDRFGSSHPVEKKTMPSLTLAAVPQVSSPKPEPNVLAFPSPKPVETKHTEETLAPGDSSPQDSTLQKWMTQGINAYQYFTREVPVVRSVWPRLVQCDFYKAGQLSCSEFGQAALSDPALTTNQKLSLITKRVVSCGPGTSWGWRPFSQWAKETESVASAKKSLNVVG